MLTTIPKVGSKSLKHAFTLDPRFSGAIEASDSSLSELIRSQPGVAELFHFSVVRNPWARAVSCYRDKILACNKMGKLSIISRYPGLSPRMAFHDYVEWLASPEGSDECADRHWISQHRLLSDDTGAVRCDYIGKLEALSDDMEELSRRIGVGAIEMPVRNRSQRKVGSEDYRTYYSPRSRALIADRYAKDIELFKYSF